VGAFSASPEPFRIEPAFFQRIWGSRSLAPLYPEKRDLQPPIGEAWLTGRECRIANGPFAGQTLAEAWKQMPVEWRGENLMHTAEFPLLAKFIFPADKLSIQVHPDDAYAAAHEAAAGGHGKTEMWYAVSAEPGAKVLAGLQPGVTKKQFMEAMESHTNLEELFLSHEVRAGDTFFIPAGTPHTIGPGMVLCEVQQYSDLTYRLYDYDRRDAQGRPRDLHIKKSLEVMKFGKTPVIKIQALRMPDSGLQFENSLLVACPYFCAELWTITKNLRSPSHLTHFDIFVILSGTGDLEAGDAAHPYRQGDCWMIPAGVGTYHFKPKEKTVALRAFLRQLPNTRQFLYRIGFSDEQVSSVTFG
jgi:mannose-6-phosphate isomerase